MVFVMGDEDLLLKKLAMGWVSMLLGVTKHYKKPCGCCLSTVDCERLGLLLDDVDAILDHKYLGLGPPSPSSLFFS